MGGWGGAVAGMAEVTIKVLPRPETEQTLLIRGLEPAQAIAAMTPAMGSSSDLSGAAHLPADVAVRAPAGRIPARALTARLLRSFLPSCAPRRPPPRGPPPTVHEPPSPGSPP